MWGRYEIWIEKPIGYLNGYIYIYILVRGELGKDPRPESYLVILLGYFKIHKPTLAPSTYKFLIMITITNPQRNV